MEFITNIAQKGFQEIRINISRILVIILLCLIYFLVTIKLIYGDLVDLKNWFQLICTIIGSSFGVFIGFISSRMLEKIKNDEEKDKQKHAIVYILRDEIYSNMDMFYNQYSKNKTDNKDLEVLGLTRFNIKDWARTKYDIFKFSDLCKDKDILDLFTLYYLLQRINTQIDTKQNITSDSKINLLGRIADKFQSCEKFIKNTINEESI